MAEIKQIGDDNMQDEKNKTTDNKKERLKPVLLRLSVMLTADVESKLTQLKISDDLNTVTAIYELDRTKEFNIEDLEIQEIIAKIAQDIKL